MQEMEKARKMQRRVFFRLLSGSALAAIGIFGLEACTLQPSSYPDRPNYNYYYYPESNVYSHIRTGYYFFIVNGGWVRSRNLPRYIFLTPAHRRPLLIREREPYARNSEHRRQFEGRERGAGRERAPERERDPSRERAPERERESEKGRDNVRPSPPESRSRQSQSEPDRTSPRQKPSDQGGKDRPSAPANSGPQRRKRKTDDPRAREKLGSEAE